MNYLMPSAWKGWTAILIIAALFIVAVVAKGYKLVHTLALVGVALVAVIGAYNTFAKSS